MFFTNSLQPTPCLKESNSSDLKSKCTVTPIGWPFSFQPIAAQCWRGRERKILKILGKNTIFNEHSVLKSILLLEANYKSSQVVWLTNTQSKRMIIAKKVKGSPSLKQIISRSPHFPLLACWLTHWHTNVILSMSCQRATIVQLRISQVQRTSEHLFRHFRRF